MYKNILTPSEIVLHYDQFSATFPDGSGIYSWSQVRGALARKPWLRKYLAQVTL